MEDWTSGYVADIGYTYGYYPELNPVAARFALVSAGLVPPGTDTACELGFGQGLAANFHAAASPTQWWGTDFNPAQAGFARELAQAAGSGARLFDEAFEDFCARPDVPEMDFIAVHGIWSWINDRNRAVIADFVRRKLKPGGVLYISYNTHPGWAAAVPMRELLAQHAEVMGAPGQGIVGRIDAALAFADRLMQTAPRYAKANPQIADRLKKMAAQDRHYLAHEYFNRDWAPMSFANMAAALGAAKLGFGCSASFLDHVENLSVSTEQAAILKEIPDAVFRQTVRDICVNQQFRKDYWVKGPRSLNPMSHKEALDAQAVVLTVPASDVKLVIPGAQPEVKLSEAVYGPVLEALGDHKPKTLSELLQAVQPKGINAAQVLQAAVVLAGIGTVQPAQTAAAVAAARPATTKLNLHLMALARGNSSTPYLASPVTGGGVPVSRFHQMFLLARSKGASSPQEWVRGAWNDLAAQGQRLNKDGVALMSPEENIAELKRHVIEFAARLPMLEGLQVA
jgi:SAM-dependent methyltransferase